MWILIAVGIESMALAGVLGVLATGRTRPAFLTGFSTMAMVTGVYVWYGDPGPRSVLVVSMVIVYLFRMNWILIAWSGQTAVSKLDSTMTTLQKVFLPFVLTNTVGWAYCLPFFFATRGGRPPGLTDTLGFGVYLVGTVLHFGSDYQKRRFKLRTGNRGALLQTGFWALCHHPNYFGDFLIYISFALVGARAWGWLAPLVNLLQYAFDAIPKNEQWAAERYGPSWAEYKARTKAFVPYVV